MSKTTVFTGTGVAIVTPMNQDGSVNFEKFRELVEWQIETELKNNYRLRHNRRSLDFGRR